MKFILDYVTCCMITTPSCKCNTDETSTPTSPLASSHVMSPRGVAEEETRSLVPTPRSSRNGRHRQRGKTAAEWRPSLLAIEEDNAVVVVPEKVRRTTAPVRRETSQRNVQRCRVNANSGSYNYSRDRMPIVIPAFSAGPFMF